MKAVVKVISLTNDLFFHLIELGFEFTHDLFEFQVCLFAGTLALSHFICFWCVALARGFL